MSKENITRAVLTTDGQVLIEQPDGSFRKEKSKTDWKRLREMRDEDIDYSDIPELDDEFWAKAELKTPQAKDRLTIRLDHDPCAMAEKAGEGLPDPHQCHFAAVHGRSPLNRGRRSLQRPVQL